MPAKKIRLLCIGRDLRGGGAERVQLFLLNELNRDRFDIQLFYLRNEGVLYSLLPQDLTPIYGVQARKSLKLYAPRILKKLLGQARKSDVILAMQEGTPIYMAVLASRLTGCPVVGWVHTPWASALSSLAPWHRWVSRYLFGSLNQIVTVSEESLIQLETLVPSLKGKVQSFPNPIPLQKLDILSREPLPAWAEGIFCKPTILAVGRLTHIKGYDLLITAFSRLILKGIDLHLLILGEGEERQALEKLALACGVQNQVFMPGFIENPYPFFKHAELFVLSSRVEGLPTVIVEALALGLPVVAANCSSGLVEILKHGQYGILIAPEKMDELSQSIEMLITSADRKAQLRKSGLSRAQYYNAPIVSMRYEELLAACTRS